MYYHKIKTKAMHLITGIILIMNHHIDNNNNNLITLMTQVNLNKITSNNKEVRIIQLSTLTNKYHRTVIPFKIIEVKTVIKTIKGKNIMNKIKVTNSNTTEVTNIQSKTNLILDMILIKKVNIFQIFKPINLVTLVLLENIPTQ
jgi:hypothetical protein